MLLKKQARYVLQYINSHKALRNTIIGAGRAMDPCPIVEEPAFPHVILDVSFDNGFAKDRANLSADRRAGMNSVLTKECYGKVTIPV